MWLLCRSILSQTLFESCLLSHGTFGVPPSPPLFGLPQDKIIWLASVYIFSYFSLFSKECRESTAVQTLENLLLHCFITCGLSICYSHMLFFSPFPCSFIPGDSLLCLSVFLWILFLSQYGITRHRFQDASSIKDRGSKDRRCLYPFPRNSRICQTLIFKLFPRFCW